MWICRECGLLFGKPSTLISTWHLGTCDWCGEEKGVTEPRDYGYPILPHNKKAWLKAQKKKQRRLNRKQTNTI